MKEMRVTERMAVDFGGLPGGSEALTWAQRQIWDAIGLARVRPGGEYLTQRHALRFPVAGPVGVDGAVEAIRRLVTRHEALRTTFQPGADGVPRQTVLESGRLPIFMYESDSAGWEHDFRCVKENAFPLEDNEFLASPVGIGIGVADGKVSTISVSVPRAAVDGWGIGLLSQEIWRCADYGGPQLHDVEPSQHRECARFEASGQGAAVTARALRYWTDALAEASRLGWSRRLGLRVSNDHCQGVMTSHALPRAVAILARRHSVSSSSVLVAAFSATLGALIGHDSFYFVLQASNRLSPAQQAAIGRYKQIGVLPIVLRASTLEELLHDAYRRVLLAYRHSRYDPVTLRDQVAALEDGPFFNFDDRRLMSEEPKPSVAEQPSYIADIRSKTAVRVDESPNHAPNPRIDLTIDSADRAGDSVRVAAKANFLPADDVGRLLTAMESILVHAVGTADTPWRSAVDHYLAAPPRTPDDVGVE